jgi:hypothetical protein
MEFPEKFKLLSNKFLNEPDGLIYFLREIGVLMDGFDRRDVAINIYIATLLLRPNSYWVRYKLICDLLLLKRFDEAKFWGVNLSDAPDFEGKDEMIKNLLVL